MAPGFAVNWIRMSRVVEKCRRRSNQIVVKFILAGPEFTLKPQDRVWSKLGRYACAKDGLTVDDKYIFAATWAAQLVRRNRESLDAVIAELLEKLQPCTDQIVEFSRKNRLASILDGYVEYDPDYLPPAINLGVSTIASLSALRAAVGLEVCRLPGASDKPPG